MNKWIGISLGTVLGVSHIGMIGLIASRSNLPMVNLPVSDYTSYSVEAGKDGYRINYRANDPLIMGVRKEIDKPAGFLGLGRARVSSEEQYTMEGSRHLGGQAGDPKLSAKAVSCIKAEGGGESTGRIVGGSIGASAASSLSTVPYVGWVLAGAATVIGMDQGAEIGGNMASSLADCDPDLIDNVEDIQ
tara:strand:+ start:241 stop:807 length:567 start_codon:yes stop_codon:yes gene_type:complete